MFFAFLVWNQVSVFRVGVFSCSVVSIKRFCIVPKKVSEDRWKKGEGNSFLRSLASYSGT